MIRELALTHRHQGVRLEAGRFRSRWRRLIYDDFGTGVAFAADFDSTFGIPWTMELSLVGVGAPLREDLLSPLSPISIAARLDWQSLFESVEFSGRFISIGAAP
ncbi:MAG: hypothetical protein R3C68_04900 [Myxococcota bacterium]